MYRIQRLLTINCINKKRKNGLIINYWKLKKHIEEMMQGNFTRILKQFSGHYNQHMMICRDKEWKMLYDKKAILERWIEYFSELLNIESNFEKEEIIVIPPNEGYQLNDPTYNEVKNIIIKLKSHRSPGPDSVPAELLKNGGSLLKSRIFKLILKIWKKEEMPKDWSEGIIYPLLKKTRPHTV